MNSRADDNRSSQVGLLLSAAQMEYRMISSNDTVRVRIIWLKEK